MYSDAVIGLPSIGDRASVIISVRSTSSGISAGGGNEKAGFIPTMRLENRQGIISVKEQGSYLLICIKSK